MAKYLIVQTDGGKRFKIPKGTDTRVIERVAQEMDGLRTPGEVPYLDTVKRGLLGAAAGISEGVNAYDTADYLRNEQNVIAPPPDAGTLREFGEAASGSAPYIASPLLGATIGGAVAGPPGAAIGGLLGFGASALGGGLQFKGDVSGELRQEGVPISDIEASPLPESGAVVAGALEGLTGKLLARPASQVAKGALKEQIKKGIARRAKEKGVEGFVTEAATETGQNILQSGVVGSVNPDDTALANIREDIVSGQIPRGALYGGLIGGGIGAGYGALPERQAPSEPPEPTAELIGSNANTPFVGGREVAAANFAPGANVTANTPEGAFRGQIVFGSEDGRAFMVRLEDGTEALFPADDLVAEPVAPTLALPAPPPLLALPAPTTPSEPWTYAPADVMVAGQRGVVPPEPNALIGMREYERLAAENPIMFGDAAGNVVEAATPATAEDAIGMQRVQDELESTRLANVLATFTPKEGAVFGKRQEPEAPPPLAELKQKMQQRAAPKPTMESRLAKMREKYGVGVTEAEVEPTVQPAVFGKKVKTRAGGLPDFTEGRLNVADILVDPKTYQFRSDTDAQGTTGRLKDVKAYDELLGDPILVHQRMDGSYYVADGHHRLDIAKRTGKQDLPVRILKESDGYTPEIVRAIAAAKNIADGKATMVDAAKAIRESARMGNAVTLPTMSDTQPGVRSAKDLAKLQDEPFGMVASGNAVKPEYAQFIGKHIPDDSAKQIAAINAMRAKRPKNQTDAEQLAIAVADRDIMTRDTEQGSMFDDTSLLESQALQEAELRSGVVQRLKNDTRAFKGYLNRPELAEQAGNILNLPENARRLAESQAAADIFTKESRSKGTPINEAMKKALARLKKGDDMKTVQRDFYDAVVKDAQKYAPKDTRTPKQKAKDKLNYALANPNAPANDVTMVTLREEPMSGDVTGRWASAPRSVQADAVKALAEKILGANAKNVKLARTLKDLDANAEGVYNATQKMMYIAMDGPDAVGTTRHEAIHLLRDMGLLSGADWGVLSGQAKRWRKHFDIDRRYKDQGLTQEQLNEEAVADAYKAWGNGLLVETRVESIMRKLRDVFNEFKRLIGMTSGVRTWEDVFNAVEAGEYAGPIASAPNYTATQTPDGVLVEGPDGSQNLFNTREEAEFWATDQEILDMQGRPELLYSLSDDEVDFVKKTNSGLFRGEKPSLLQNVREAANEATERGMKENWRMLVDNKRLGLKITTGVFDSTAPIAALRQGMERTNVALRLIRASKKAYSILNSVITFGGISVDDKGNIGVGRALPAQQIFTALFNAQGNLYEVFKGGAYATNALTKNPRMVETGEKDAKGKPVMKMVEQNLFDTGRERNITQEQAERLKAIADKTTFRVNYVKWNEETKAYDKVSRDMTVSEAIAEIQATNREILDFAVKMGRITQDQREFWDRNGYMPLHRAMDDMADSFDESGIYRGTKKKFDITQQLTGGPTVYHVVDENGYHKDSYHSKGEAQKAAEKIGGTVREGAPRVEDPMVAYYSNWGRLIHDSLANAGAVKAIEDMVGQGLARFEKVVEPMKNVKESDIRDILETAGVNTEGMEAGDLRAILQQVTLPGDDTGKSITVFQNGKKVRYQISDPLIHASLSSIYQATPPMNNFMKALSMSRVIWSRIIVNTLTTQIPLFIKDAMQRFIIGRDGGSLVGDVVKASGKAYVKYDPEVMAMAYNGADMSSVYDRPLTLSKDAEKLAKQAQEGALKYYAKPWHWLEGMDKISHGIERINRLATNRSAKLRGATDAEAGFEAADNHDYTLHGLWPFVNAMSAVTPFFNASLQGLYRNWRAAKGNTPQFLQRAGMVLLGPAMLLALINGTEDEDEPEGYFKQAQHTRDGNFMIPYGRMMKALTGEELENKNLNYLKVPLPFEIGWLFGALPTRLLHRAMGKETPGETSSALLKGFEAQMPTPFINNPVAKPAIELYTNYSFFTGDPIIPAYMENKPAKERADANSSGTAIALGELGISPKYTDHLLGMFGLYGLGVQSVGTAMKQSIDGVAAPDTRLDQKIFARSFLSQYPTRSNEDISRVYDVYNEAQAAYSSYKDALTSGNAEEIKSVFEANKGLLQNKPEIYGMYNRMREVQKQIKLVKESKTMTGAQKLERITDLQVQLNRVVSKITAVMKKVEGAD